MRRRGDSKNIGGGVRQGNKRGIIMKTGGSKNIQARGGAVPVPEPLHPAGPHLLSRRLGRDRLLVRCHLGRRRSSLLSLRVLEHRRRRRLLLLPRICRRSFRASAADTAASAAAASFAAVAAASFAAASASAASSASPFCWAAAARRAAPAAAFFSSCFSTSRSVASSSTEVAALGSDAAWLAASGTAVPLSVSFGLRGSRDSTASGLLLAHPMFTTSTRSEVGG